MLVLIIRCIRGAVIATGICMFLLVCLSIWAHWTPNSESPLEIGSITLIDARGITITQKGLPDGYGLPYTGSLDIPLIQALIQVEDRRFYQHSGIDIWGKIASIKENISAGGIVRGGSTLTEQYIKNTFFPKAHRTFAQKLREALWAQEIEWKYDKEILLRKYIDSLYFGNRIYGIKAYIQTYYTEYNESEIPKEIIVDILARIRTPNIHPGNEAAFFTYKQHIIQKLGWTDVSASYQRPERNVYSIDQFPLLTERILQEKKQYCHNEKNHLGHFTRTIPQNACQSTSLALELTVDSILMRYIEETLHHSLSTLEKKHITAGAVYIWNPTENTVLAYVPSRGRRKGPGSDIDMITRKRSSGSLLKPFIFLLALRSGADSESLILDSMKAYPTDQGKDFIPFNYIPTNYGPVPLREALANSLNSATVRLIEILGVQKVYDFFTQELQLSLEHDAGYYGYGIGLGTAELSLENIVHAYAHLTRLSIPENFLIREMLRLPKNRKKVFGMNSILNTSILLPVKTGTSTDFRDNWTVSYSPTHIIGVWVGNTDQTPMKDVSGISGAGGIWHKIVEYMIAEKYIQDTLYTPPQGIIHASLCSDIHCYQKESIYTKNISHGHILHNKAPFPRSRFFGDITEEEMQTWDIIQDT